MKIEMGECIYCGQVQQFETEDGISLSQEEKNRRATEQCDCDKAKNAQAQEKILTTTQKKHQLSFSCRQAGNGKASA